MNTFDILSSVFPKEKILKDEPMSEHTSFRTGGTARFFAMPSTEEEIVLLVDVLRKNKKPYTVIGNGSNLLVSDLGFDGTVIALGKQFSQIKAEGDKIYAMAGALLSRIAAEAQRKSLTGFEFASGIPGSLGGAVMMNAGAYGGEMKDVVTKTRYISADGTIKEAKGSEHGFGYRKSVFTKEDIILGSEINLKKGNIDEIKALTAELNAKRREKQPLEYPSAGSTFKRPEGYFAAKLIDDAGLRGFSVGGAMVSEKHCGFVINYDNATSNDIYTLMKEIKKIVFDKFGVILEPEVRLVGNFDEF